MEMAADNFVQTVWTYYRAHGRHGLPWRQAEPHDLLDPYKILVSELMLQQTQVSRVIPKYEAFLRRFPTVHALATASLGEVLIAWQGLGYNRRAKFLWQAAQTIKAQYGGVMPDKASDLENLPGIGSNTAAAILAYSFNTPVVFVETNIRTVFIHHYFKNQSNIPDKAVLALVEQTLDRSNPREWYWALMDYGAYLKQTVGNLSRRSGTYTKQGEFSGSTRQLRGRILRRLAEGMQSKGALLAYLSDDRAEVVLGMLEEEELLRCEGGQYQLP